jgi:hypothetical protein
MFLLDTNVVSEMRKANTPRIDPGVAQWVARTESADMFLSAIVIEELEVGVRRAERRDPPFGVSLRYWLDTQVLPNFRERILPIDTVVALATAPFQFPINRPFRDGLIAATALVHGLTIVTRNTADFEPLGVGVINPWNAGAPRT